MLLSVLSQFLLTHLTAAHQRLVVAYSGGVDSHVLLDALVQLQSIHQRSLLAVHVHHGLSQYADNWAAHVQTTAAAYGVPCCIKYITVNSHASLEACAREARYHAINQELQTGDVLLLAHHQQDQAETLLLRLCRGTGVTGLKAMSAVSPVPYQSALMKAWRPLLTLTKGDILAYAQAQQLSWIEDESNGHLRFDRNFLRQQVFPILRARWPHIDARLTQTSRLMAEADALLNEMAAADYQHALDDTQQALVIERLQPMSRARRHQLFRYWLKQLALNIPDYADIERIWTEVCLAKADAQPLLAWAGVEIRRYRQHLFAMSPLKPFNRRQEYPWLDKNQPLMLACGQTLSPQLAQQGIRPELWQTGALCVRYRQGGEKIQPVGRHCHHDLKKLLQASAIPPWQRDRLLLLYINQQLAAVIGYWVAVEFAAEQPLMMKE
ncbi:tRNA lysidine(34) synthetase TilS [Agitococcus lubricus]|uniref:tRNA(Ile)-lysidine synthase n=1 Tax=Agitococcus lubricus TaxID=1077255 RepID=A0A2T5J2B9_9GAMM|nr:tRNA lysidine(34) synthetase TilS [Agitococcus lubricus]PTQ90665.1 tRNA(Ile)-lysidine synthase [Agitococcus lubricus]